MNKMQILKQMKQITLIGLALSSLLLCFTSCGKENGTDVETEVCDCDKNTTFTSISENVSEDISKVKIFMNSSPIDVYFANNSVGYVSGSYDSDKRTSVIAKTTDGGKTWIEMPVLVNGMNTYGLHNIYAKNEDVIYAYFDYSHYQDQWGTVVSSIGGICRSEDGGCSWNIVEHGKFWVEFLLSSGKEIITLSPGEIVKIQDGSFTLLYTSENIAYRFENSSLSINDNPSGSVSKTTDGGNSWFSLESLGSLYACELVFVDDNTGYIIADDGAFKTTDGGDSWSILRDITEMGLGYCSPVITKNNDIYLKDKNKILRTKDEFMTFETIFENETELEKLVHASEESLVVLSIRDNSIIRVNPK